MSNDNTDTVFETYRSTVSADHQLFDKRLDTALFIFWRDSRFPDGKGIGWKTLRGERACEITSPGRLLIRVQEFQSGVQDIEVYQLATDDVTVGMVDWFRRWLANRYGAMLENVELDVLYTWKEKTSEQDPAPANNPSSGHFAHPREGRQRIANETRQAIAAGKIADREAWAKSKYGISWKTVKRYMAEFPADT